MPVWVPVFWAASLVLGLLVAAPGTARASDIHPDSTAHLNNVHFASAGYGEEDEQFCIESHDTSRVSHAAGATFVNDVLVGYSASQNWDGLGDWRIDLRKALKNCTAYDSATRATIEIEVHYAANWNHICGGDWGYYNCVVRDKPVWNSTYGHYDSQWAYVYLVFSSGGQLNDRGRAFINHEFGHVFGLTDAGDCSPPSLMHSTRVGYGCGNWTASYPSPADYQSVVNVMNGA